MMMTAMKKRRETERDKLHYQKDDDDGNEETERERVRQITLPRK